MVQIRFILIVVLAGFVQATPVCAQAPNANVAAVDTLTKNVAAAVFANQRGAKAREILNQLDGCGGNCDVVSIIRTVGGWEPVGDKMEELGRIKSTAQFRSLSPGDANAAIRQQLAQFYNRYKDDKNYGIPLAPAVQTQLLAKVDRMLPPAVGPQPAPKAAGQPADGQVAQVVTPDGGGEVDKEVLRINQLEGELKREQGNRIWMMILSAIAGLIAGAAVVYFMLYRALMKEVDRLTRDNAKLSRDLDVARQQRVANEPRQPQPGNRAKPDLSVSQSSASASPVRDHPVRDHPVRDHPGESTPGESTPGQLIEPVDPKPVVTPIPAIRSGEPVPGPVPTDPVIEPIVVPALNPTPMLSQTQSTAPVSAPARSDVFYFPPPDPTGQFDNAQRTDMLLPESAYRFSTNAGLPEAATFRFEAEPGRVARFLTYRNYMIEPACDSENSFSSTYTRVANRRDGEAMLENGVWRVKTKALIRYE